MEKTYRDKHGERNFTERFLSWKEIDGQFNFKEEQDFVRKLMKEKDLKYHQWKSYWKEWVLEGHYFKFWPFLKDPKYENKLAEWRELYDTRIFTPIFGEEEVRRELIKYLHFGEIDLSDDWKWDRDYKIDQAYLNFISLEPIIIQVKSSVNGALYNIEKEVKCQRSSKYKTSCVYIAHLPTSENSFGVKKPYYVLSYHNKHPVEFSEINQEMIDYIIELSARNKRESDYLLLSENNRAV